jgi:4-amino-4-deoxy-L-arabinose transferase-like glycosyltransferase
MTKKRQTPNENWQAVAALLALAFALRVIFLWLAGANTPLTGDEFAYQQIAENIAAGRGLFQTNNPFFPRQILYAWQAPLYPLALGGLYKILGAHILAAKFFGVVVGTATVYVVYDLTRRVFRAPLRAQAVDECAARRIALGAGLLVAIYPGFLTLAHLLLSEGLFILFVLLAFDFIARALAERAKRRWAWFGAAAVAWGLATLTRGLTLYFLPLLALWLGWVLWRADGRRSVWRNAIAPAFVFILIALAVIAPYTARNYARFHQFVLLETKGGVNLWLGNSPYTPYEFIRNVWKVGVREPMLQDLPTDEVARDRAAMALALQYMRAEPLAVLARVPAKFADFWGMERNLVDVAEATRAGGGWNSIFKSAADVYGALAYMFVALCGLAGFIYARADKWKILFGGFSAYFLALHLIIFGDGRFHLPLMPLFAMYAAWWLVNWKYARHTVARVSCVVIGATALWAVWAREAWVAWSALRGGH